VVIAISNFMPGIMRVLEWQWGRRGAGPRFAAELARNFAAVPETETLLSLAARAEIGLCG